MSRIVQYSSKSWAAMLVAIISLTVCNVVWATNYNLNVTAGCSGALSPNPVAVGEEALATLTGSASRPQQGVEGQLNGPYWRWSYDVQYKATQDGIYSTAWGNYNIGIIQPSFSSPSATLSCTFTLPGYWKVNVKNACGYIDAYGNTWNGEGTTSVTVAVFAVSAFKIRPRGTSDWKEDQITIAAGAIDNDVHQADVLVEVTPPLSGKLKIQMLRGQGHAGSNDAKLAMGSVNIGPDQTEEVSVSGGSATGTLTSSNMLTSAIIKAGGYSRTVAFGWSNYSGQDEWVSDPGFIVVGGQCTQKLKLMRDGKALKGHSINFYVEKITWIDQSGQSQTSLNTPDSPGDLSRWASFESSSATTDDDGVAAATLRLGNCPEVTSITMKAYDMTVWQR